MYSYPTRWRWLHVTRKDKTEIQKMELGNYEDKDDSEMVPIIWFTTQADQLKLRESKSRDKSHILHFN